MSMNDALSRSCFKAFSCSKNLNLNLSWNPHHLLNFRPISFNNWVYFESEHHTLNLKCFSLTARTIPFRMSFSAIVILSCPCLFMSSSGTGPAIILTKDLSQAYPHSSSMSSSIGSVTTHLPPALLLGSSHSGLIPFLKSI